MSGYSFTLHPEVFREQVLNADWMVEEMRARADRGREFAESTAPVSSGEYKSSFEVEAGKHGGIHHDRAEAILSSRDPAALPIEFGHQAPNGEHVEGSYTLTRAADVMGA